MPPASSQPDDLLDEELTLADLPSCESNESAIHQFALTTSGYERMGSFERCAALANAALEKWRTGDELPSTLGDLRCCLFFEQRRWRHFGQGFDDETLVYVRALIDAMRPLVASS